MSNTYASVAITNQLALPIDIYDQFGPGTTGQPKQPLNYTKLATIAAGATEQVACIRQVALLTATVSTTFSDLGNNFYRNFPVKTMSGTQDTYGTPAPLAYTVTEADRGIAVASFQFHKFMMANPDAAMAKNFNTALKSGFAAVNTFFQGTANFKACTMASWHGVMNWLNNFTSGWQGPYYLYQAPPSPQPAGYVPVLVATLNVVSDASNDSAVLRTCSADASGNPDYSSSQRSTLQMTGGSVMEDNEPGTDVPVSLTPLWMNVVQTPLVNGQPTPRYLIGNAVSGTVGPIAVISSQTIRKISSTGSASGGDSGSMSWDKIFNKGVGIIGALAGLVAIYEFVSKKFGKGEAAKEAAKDQATDTDDLQAREEQVDQEIQAELNDPDDGLPTLAADADADAAAVKSGYDGVVQEMQGEVLHDAIEEKVNALEQSVQEDLNNGDTPSEAFENAWSDMQTEAGSALGKIDSGDMTSWNESFEASLSDLNTAVQTSDSTFSESVSDLQASYQDANTQSEDLNSAAENYENESANADEDSGYNEADDNDPPVVDEMPVEAVA